MVASVMPCPTGQYPFCVEDARLFMHCGCGTGDEDTFVEILALISVTFRANVTRSTKSRYFGTAGAFVSGCAGRREPSWQVRYKWCLDAPFAEDDLHGKCACFRFHPDYTNAPTEYIELYGRVQLDQPQTFNNNSTDDVESGFSIDAILPENWTNMPEPTLTLGDCGA